MSRKHALAARLERLRAERSALASAAVFARRQVRNMDSANATIRRHASSAALRRINYCGTWRESKVAKCRAHSALGRLLQQNVCLEVRRLRRRRCC